MPTFWTDLRTVEAGVSVMVTADDATGTILAMGDRDLLQEMRRLDKRVSLDGAFVTPGFWDSHFHLMEYGRALGRIAFESQDSMAAVLRRVDEASSKAADGAWVVGGGWNRDRLGATPRMKELNRVSHGHPVALMSLDTHTVWVNTVAMKALELERRATLPYQLEREPGGDFTGIVCEKLAFWVQEAVARLEATPDRDVLQRAFREANRLGLVGVTTMEPAMGFRSIQQWDGPWPLRVQVFLTDQSLPGVVDGGWVSGFGSECLRFMGIKIFTDGALGSETAWMKSPYHSPAAGMGRALVDPEELRDLIERAKSAELAVAVHAIGDAAVHHVGDVIARTGFPSYRHIQSRIEHAQLIDPEDWEIVAAAGTALSMQPVHLLVDRTIADTLWGARAAHAFPIASMARLGVRVIFGSDAPVATPDPRLGLYASVHRRNPDGHDASWYGDESYTAAEAVKAYTLYPALADGRASGKVAVGCWGDFTVWERDPVEALRDDDFGQLVVVATVVGGRLVYRA